MASHSLVWMICDKFHVYQTKVHIEGTSARGCPICQHLVLVPGVNDFATTHPDQAAAFVAPGPSHKTPETASALSRATALWRCNRGHEFSTSFTKMSVQQRNHCRCDEHKRLNRGYSDLASRNPVLAAQWDTERNGTTPDNIDVGSHTKYWWICPAGHHFQTSPKERMRGSSTGNGCRQCLHEAPIDPHTHRAVVPADLRPTPQQLRDYFRVTPRRRIKATSTTSPAPSRDAPPTPRRYYSDTTKKRAVDCYRLVRDRYPSHTSTLQAVAANLAPDNPQPITIDKWVRAAGVARRTRSRQNNS